MRIAAQSNGYLHGCDDNAKEADTNSAEPVGEGGIRVGLHGGDAMLEGREGTEGEGGLLVST